MLVMDEVSKGKLSLTERVLILLILSIYQGEHDNYVVAGGSTTGLQKCKSILFTLRIPSLCFCGTSWWYGKFKVCLDKYGKSKGEVKTTQMHGNKTTTDYYIQFWITLETPR